MKCAHFVCYTCPDIELNNAMTALREAQGRGEHWIKVAEQYQHEILFRCTETQVAIAERDEARAEVERLRSAISRFVTQYPWQAGPEIQELKALKGDE